MVTALSVFRSTGMWPINRDVFQDHYLFPCVVNTPGAEFVQPIQAELQVQTGKVKSLHIEQVMEIHPSWFQKLSPLPEAHVACSIKKKHTSKVSHKAIEVTSPPCISALQATRKRKRVSQNRPGNFRQK